MRALEHWAQRFPERRWAVENASGLGRHLAGTLAAAGKSVVDVPPKLSARVRVLSSFAGNARKNDSLDALATALAASRNGRLAVVDPEATSELLRLLSERREDLVAERTSALNRLHGLLRDLLPGGVGGTLSAHRAARILRGIRPKGGASAHLRRRLASEVLRDVRTRDVGTFLQSQFEENLGAKVQVRALPVNNLLQQTAAGDYDFYHGGSIAAYNDPMDFLEVWSTHSPLNQSGFSNAQYDRLVEGAKVETDPTRRLQQLAQAEKILIEEEAVLAPTLHVCFSRLIRPSVEGLVFHPYGVFVDFKYASIREE